MSDFDRISKNSIYSFLSIFFRLFSNVILFWLIARFYGKELFGQFTIAQTFASVYVIFADFGLDMLLTIEISRRLSDSTNIFRRYFSVKFVLVVIVFLILIGITFISNFSSDVRQLIIIFGFYGVFTTLTNFLYALFKGNEKLKYETKVSFFVNASSLIVLLPLIFLKQSIVVIAIIFVFMRLSGLLIALFFSFKILPTISFKLDFSQFKETWKKIIVFGLFLIFGNLYFQLDTILLAYMVDNSSVGEYQAVFRLVMLPLIIPTIFVNSIMPALSRFNSQDIIKWEKLGYILNKLLIIISIPISIILFVFAEQIISLIYGKAEYGPAIPILKFFAVIVFIRFFAETFGLMLTTSNRQKSRMIIVLVATIINLVMNLILIPIYGIKGAAVTSLVTNLFVAILFFIVTREISISWLFRIFNPQLLFAAAVVILLSLILNETFLWYMVIIPLVLYFFYIYRFSLTIEERKYVSELRFLRKRA